MLLGQQPLGRSVVGLDDLDRIDLGAHLREDCRLIAGVGTGFQHHIAGLDAQQIGH
jgi:hypothetical protein